MKLKGVSPGIILLGTVSFLNDMSSEMIMPILPMLITSLGGAGIAIGLIGGIRDSISTILTVVFGYISDKIGKRRIFVLSGYLASTIFKFFLAISTTWHQILIFGGLERIGKSIRTAPRDAMISEYMPNHKGKGFGIHRTFDTAGAIMGSIISFLLVWKFGLGFRTIILASAIIAFASMIPMHFVKEKAAAPQKNLSLKISIRALPKELKLFLLVAIMFTLANFSYMFLILKAQKSFGGNLTIAAPILLYILFNIFYATFSTPFGSLSDKIGKGKMLAMGYTIFTLTMLGFAIFSSAAALATLFIMYGLAYAMIEGIQRAFVSDLSPKNIRATALGTFHTLIGLIALPASVIAGALWQITPTAPFIYGAALSASAATLMIIFRNNTRLINA